MLIDFENFRPAPATRQQRRAVYLWLARDRDHLRALIHEATQGQCSRLLALLAEIAANGDAEADDDR